MKMGILPNLIKMAFLGPPATAGSWKTYNTIDINRYRIAPFSSYSSTASLANDIVNYKLICKFSTKEGSVLYQPYSKQYRANSE
jgi:hypothetical protein